MSIEDNKLIWESQYTGRGNQDITRRSELNRGNSGEGEIGVAITDLVWSSHNEAWYDTQSYLQMVEDELIEFQDDDRLGEFQDKFGFVPDPKSPTGYRGTNSSDLFDSPFNAAGAFTPTLREREAAIFWDTGEYVQDVYTDYKDEFQENKIFEIIPLKKWDKGNYTVEIFEDEVNKYFTFSSPAKVKSGLSRL